MALILPALVKAKAPPPKTSKQHTFILKINTEVVAFTLTNQDIVRHSYHDTIYSFIACNHADLISKHKPGLVIIKVNYNCAKENRKLAGMLFMPDKVGWRSYNI